MVLPRLSIVADVAFLIDTGADGTVLMPLDAARMGIDYGQLQNVVDSVGIGGVSRDFSEDSMITFTDGFNLYVYTPTIRIPTPSPEIMTVPSLLGRDIINRWDMRYHYSGSLLEINVVTADLVIPIPSAP